MTRYERYEMEGDQLSDDRRAAQPGGRSKPGNRHRDAGRRGGRSRAEPGRPGARDAGRGQPERGSRTGSQPSSEGSGRPGAQGVERGRTSREAVKGRAAGAKGGPPVKGRPAAAGSGSAAASRAVAGRPAGQATDRRRTATPAQRDRRAGSDTAGERNRPSAARVEIPAHITADQLDPSVRAELRSLPRDLADRVARHLAAADQATEAEVAVAHALAARRLAGRVGIVRETCGVAAYLAGHWADALPELRAARRLTGHSGYLAMMADCERALGRYDRALAIVTGPDAASANRAEQIELRIVESGIRRDMGATGAAVVLLQVPELTQAGRPWSARLWYAYADALLAAGRADDAREWFRRAAVADTGGETDAAARFEELDDITIEDLEDAEPEGACGPSQYGT